LPSVRELQSLIDFGQANPSLPPGHPFSQVQPSLYWSSTSVGAAPSAWSVELDAGTTFADGKFLPYHVWPVRDALQPAERPTAGSRAPWRAAVPLPDRRCQGVPATGQSECWDEEDSPSECSGTGQDGEHQNGWIVGPYPRFTDRGDGTVKDNLTGLVWLKNTSCFAQADWTTALANANDLASGSCGLTDGSMAGDWRLPNVRELQSLIDFGQLDPALPSGHPFPRFPPASSIIYWSSTTFVGSPDLRWVMISGCGRSATAADSSRRTARSPSRRPVLPAEPEAGFDRDFDPDLVDSLAQ
jgi:hypothetical protein